ncbi:hypothetical protein EJ110_NYTH16591 [Nymphaea thermarum]|nr:hypothetical protein EJ110_NYTH16591 [Nymphaea thermarum]
MGVVLVVSSLELAALRKGAEPRFSLAAGRQSDLWIQAGPPSLRPWLRVVEAVLCGSPVARSTVKGVVGGWAAMIVTFGVLRIFSRAFKTSVSYEPTGRQREHTARSKSQRGHTGRLQRVRQLLLTVVRLAAEGLLFPLSMRVQPERTMAGPAGLTAPTPSITGETDTRPLLAAGAEGGGPPGSWPGAAPPPSAPGANDGLVSVSSLMLGVGAVNSASPAMVVSGLADLVAGACSKAMAKFIFVYSQRERKKKPFGSQADDGEE